MIKAVIFDCFGVLTQDGWLSFCEKYRNKENEEQLRSLNHQVDRGLIGYEAFLEQVCELTGVSKSEAHTEIITPHAPNQPVFEVVKTLKNGGYKLGIISNVGASLDRYLAHEYIGLFDTITLSYQVGVIKPDPKIYQDQLDKLELEPEETVFIDDRESNVNGATAVGMEGIYYRNPEDLRTDLAKLGIDNIR